MLLCRQIADHWFCEDSAVRMRTRVFGAGTRSRPIPGRVQAGRNLRVSGFRQRRLRPLWIKRVRLQVRVVPPQAFRRRPVRNQSLAAHQRLVVMPMTINGNPIIGNVLRGGHLVRVNRRTLQFGATLARPDARIAEPGRTSERPRCGVKSNSLGSNRPPGSPGDLLLN